MLNESKSVSENLSVLTTDIFDQINDTAQHCVTYRSGEQIPNQPLVFCGGWPGAKRAWETRDALYYRAASLQWHTQLIRTVIDGEIPLILSKDTPSGLDQNTVNNSLSRIGYAFDDLIFNSMSLFDYLAKFISSVGFWTDKPRQCEWSGLLNPKNEPYLEHEHLVSIIKKTNDIWVKKLDGLRSQIIHNRPEVGGLTHTTERTAHGSVDKISFYVPEKAVAKFPVFQDSNEIELIDGAEAIALQSLVFTAEILKLMRNIHYECLHNPHKANRKQKSKRYESIDQLV